MLSNSKSKSKSHNNSQTSDNGDFKSLPDSNINRKKHNSNKIVGRSPSRPKTADTHQNHIQKKLFKQKIDLVENAKNDHLNLVEEQQNFKLKKLKSQADLLEI